MEVSLRPYQQEAVDALNRYLHQKKGNPLLVLPTGSGKSHIQAGFIQQILKRYPNTKILCLTHVKELISQNVEKVHQYMPSFPVGIYSAGLGKRDLGYQVTFAGIQSIHKKRFDAPHLIIIDESHLIPKSGMGMYRTFLDRIQDDNPKVRIIGMTATPFRLKGGPLTGGKGKIFDSIVYDLPIQKLIDNGSLAPVVSAKTSTSIDTSGVKVTAGEYNLKQLGEASDTNHVTDAAIKDAIGKGLMTSSAIIFCVSVSHAMHVRNALRLAGVSTECVTGETPGDERKRILEAYKAGQIKALTNCNVLTTGFDAPRTNMIILLRPTISPGLYVQMVGRGMRPAEGKDNCLVLDYGGNISRHGPVDNVIMPKPQGDGKGEAPVKFCPICMAECHAAKRMCDECGHVFEMEEKTMGQRASKLAILQAQKKVEERHVTRVGYSRHVNMKKGSVSMRVDYYDGFLKVGNEWICLEHRGIARHEAEKWWMRRDKYLDSVKDVPKDVRKALELSDDLYKPSKIYTRKKGQYDEIVRYEFDSVE